VNPAPLLSHPRYLPGAVLGRGAQGLVLRVTDREAPERALVAKVLHGDVRSELLAEFALLARTRIPGLARAHDLGRDAATGATFLVEDFIDGPDAARHVAAQPGPAARNRALARLVADVAHTLGALHEAGFVHGDLKPEHVRVPAAGRAMLLDLGAAVAREQGEWTARATLVTRAYAAPEVLAGGVASPAADMYGLGALAWGAATGEPPPAERGELRANAPWLSPRLASVVEALLAAHPADRPGAAADVLRMLGESAELGGWEAAAGAPAGRAHEWAEVLRSRAPVLYLTGPSGSGKSHLARELVATTLLGGRPARMLGFPTEDARLVPCLAAFFRGEAAAFPFHTSPGDALLLVLDDMEAAPQELASAVEALRCRGGDARTQVVVTSRRAPRGAPSVTLGALDQGAFVEVALQLGVPADEARALHGTCDGLPGWLLAVRGRVPLTRDTALERVRALTPAARDLAVILAILGGEAPADVLAAAAPGEGRAALGELLRASLVSRHTRGDESGDAPRLCLASPSLATDLAGALATHDLADRAAAAALSGHATAKMLLAVALCPAPPARRAELLQRAAARARAAGARTEELDALLAAAAEPQARSAALLLRLERLTRDLGTASAHPHVLTWLDELGRAEPSALPLALRRRAEASARAGKTDDARTLAASALDAARARGDATQEALALATAGAVALFRADWATAERALVEARSIATTFPPDDPEELARLDHNLGVVLLYRNRNSDAAAAFERSLAVKRSLGDAAGARACLLNLGLARTREARFDDAEQALVEAALLAESLEQVAGRAWTLAAHAELELRRQRPRDAERFTTEAEAVSDTLPAAIRADLVLLRAEIALADGDGAAALGALARVDDALRAEDALVGARALILEARARLATSPPEPRRAARLALGALRRARASGLTEQDAAARAVLTAARARSKTRYVTSPAMIAPPTHVDRDAPFWAWLATLGTGLDAGAAGVALAVELVRAAAAERAFIAVVDASGAPRTVWGADLDGLPIQDATARVDAACLASALRARGAVYQREVTGPAGTGSRLAIASAPGASPRTVVVVEHRFAPARFDGVDAALAARWSTLAALVARLHDAAGTTRASTVAPALESDGAALSSSSTLLAEPRRDYPTIVGDSRAIRRAVARLDAAVSSDLPVLLSGETGTGKEVFARALHDHGPRAAFPFVAVNCASIPDALFEAELFGHARGSFTGAERPRGGLLARAGRGTLFLDEVGELPPARQASLLRVLETRSFRPVGSDDEQPLEARVVAATNRDLERAVAEGSFRRDLLFRLNVLDVKLPALRERAEDIPTLAAAFLARSGSTATFAPEAADALSAYAWPGNARELLHQMQRLAAAGIVRVERKHLPREIRNATPAPVRTPPRDDASREARERAEVDAALAATGGNITHAAARLGVTRHGLKKRMLRLGMRVTLSASKT
jgi:serine/threonine-protein kinase PknK